MDQSDDIIQLRVPPQDLKKLSFSGHTPKKLLAWLEALPMINIGESSRLLYSAIQELNRLAVDPLTRFQLMELIRPRVNYICNSLSKHYLNKSIVLPQKASKVASLAQALQNYLAIGYKLVIVQGVAKIKDKDYNRAITLSIHHAMHHITGNLLRCLQLYFPTPSNLWRELHRLLLLADHYKLTNVEVLDESSNQPVKTTIREAYLKAVLLATCKPNQLRQKEIDHVYQFSRQCVPFVSLSTDSEQSLFAVNLAGDQEPIYSAMMSRAQGPSQYVRFISTEALSDQLKAHLQQNAFSQLVDSQIEKPDYLSDELVRHLIQCWGVAMQRSFSRSPAQGSLNICLGMSAAHYHVADKKVFETFLLGNKKSAAVLQDSDENNPFLVNKGPFKTGGGSLPKPAPDVWANAFDAIDVDDITKHEHLKTIQFDNTEANGEDGEGSEIDDKFPTHNCELVNTSPGGYCVGWNNEVPDLVKTGEIIGIQERNQFTWSIGTIRWVKQFHKEGARMGLELLAPKAQAIGAKLIPKKGGEGTYMRAFLLPALKAISQPATLITPHVGFHVGCKIMINEQGEEYKAQLIKQINSSASYIQFQFKFLTKPPEKPSSKESTSMEQDDDFDSIWSSL